jgi:hypothetical protein
MRLNGWERLWVVIAVLWMFPIALFTYGLWPTTANVSKHEVYMRIKPNVALRLADYYEVLAAQYGGTVVVVPRIAELRQDKEFMGASAKDQKAYLSHIDPDFAKASPLDQNAYLGQIIGITGPTVNIDGHTVQFVTGVSEDEMNETTRAYDAALRRVLALKRATLFGEAFGCWMIPVISVYAFGMAIQWVRRGFNTPKI